MNIHVSKVGVVKSVKIKYLQGCTHVHVSKVGVVWVEFATISKA